MKKKTDLKNVIKNAATNIFLKDGYQKVSMRNIAVKIGYSPTTIYLYYKNKGELLRDILDDYNQVYLQKEVSILESEDSCFLKLGKILTLYVTHAVENPEMFKLLATFFENIQRRDMETEENNSFLSLKNLITDCIEQNYFAEENVDKITQVFWMHVFGVASLLVNKPDIAWGDKNELIDFSITKMISSFQKI